MNIQEHLLTCIMEEAAEVQLAAAKALRFGLDDGYPGTDRTNRGDLGYEITDLMAVVQLAEQYAIALKYGREDKIVNKQDKVNKMMGGA